MRPLDKKLPNEVVKIKTSDGKILDPIIQSEYRNYRDAKLPLIGNFGRYCSYCEALVEVGNLEVEHCIPKSKGGSEVEWDNFLLSCKSCNSIKSNKDIAFNCHFPHTNNTFLDFIYDEAGRVKVNPNLPEVSKLKAQNLVGLLGLDRNCDNVTQSDFRWQRRLESWDKAVRTRERYVQGTYDENDVILYAQEIGHWSIWFTVFEGIDKVLSRLISDFEGTCASCFDAQNHFRPVYRNPLNIGDPV